MQGTSKVIMGATLVMVLSLAIVLGLILVLLAELYCSLLLRRRRFRTPPQNSTITASPPSPSSPPTIAIVNPSLSPRLPPTSNSADSFSTFYSHGVICAPRNFLFPAKEKEEPKKAHHYQLPQAIDIEDMQNPSPPFPPSPSPVSGIFSQSRKIVVVQDEKTCSVEKEILYISNPIFDGDSSRMKMEETPFQTPNSSPSALQKCDASSSSSSSSQSPVSDSPPLMQMKLPDEACSVSLGDAKPSQTWNSDTNSNNAQSSSSTGSRCTSPSW